MHQTIKECGCVVRIRSAYYKDYYISDKHNNSVTTNVEHACIFRNWPYCTMVGEVQTRIKKGCWWDVDDDSSINKEKMKFPKNKCEVDAPTVERVTTVEKRLKV